MDSRHEPTYRIGSAAKLLGVSGELLRLYERMGLIIVHKTDGKQRLYSDADLERIRCIRHAINEMKISIAGIRMMHAMIPCWETVDCPADQRLQCPAFTRHDGGCWTHRHEHNVCAQRECRACDVYIRSANCDQIKSLIHARHGYPEPASRHSAVSAEAFNQHSSTSPQ